MLSGQKASGAMLANRSPSCRRSCPAFDTLQLHTSTGLSDWFLIFWCFNASLLYRNTSPCHALILTHNEVQQCNFGGKFSHRDMSSSGKALLLPWHGKACLDAQFEIQHCRLTLELPTFHVAIVESLNERMSVIHVFHVKVKTEKENHLII